ncbi:hypothetical protein SRHO_G00231150 [Serrasalmus rhombeus]
MAPVFNSSRHTSEQKEYERMDVRAVDHVSLPHALPAFCEEAIFRQRLRFFTRRYSSVFLLLEQFFPSHTQRKTFIMGLCFSKQNQTEELISQNEEFDHEGVLDAQNLSFYRSLSLLCDQSVMEEVPDAMAVEKEQLTDHGTKLSVECEEDPEGLGGEVVFGNQSFPLSF